MKPPDIVPVHEYDPVDYLAGGVGLVCKGKHRYATAALARAAIRRKGEKGPSMARFCPTCSHFHITSTPR